MAFYTVQQGYTLGTIAQAFGTTLDAPAAANPDILDPNQIFAGQTLCVHAWSTHEVREGDTPG